MSKDKECLTGKCCWMTKLAFTLVVIGALNWGLIGAMDYNLVNSLLGQWEVAERVVYVLVGLSGLFMMVKHCMKCKKK